MTAEAYVFGRAIIGHHDPESGEYKWTFDDSDGYELQRTPSGLPKVDWPCPKCGEHRTPKGHDPCIANLPGVEYACCGHGVERGYAKFEDGRVLRGQFDYTWEK